MMMPSEYLKGGLGGVGGCASPYGVPLELVEYVTISGRGCRLVALALVVVYRTSMVVRYGTT